MSLILVVDDESDVRTLFRTVLEDAGHTVLEAADGGAGVKLYREWLVDVVLCDIMMPVQDGLTTIRELRHEFPDARIIAMSGGSGDFAGDVLEVAAYLGALRVLDKPIAVDRLLRTVAEVLGLGCG